MRGRASMRWALLLGAAIAGQSGAAPAKVDLGAVKRELWSADVGLEQASVSFRGLDAIAGDDQAYDPQVAGELRSRVVQDLRRAEQHLGLLWQVPGQDDAKMRKVAELQDSMRGVRERVENLGRRTRAGFDPRADTRKGAGRVPPRARTLKQDDPRMPPLGSEALLDTRADLKAVWGALQEVQEKTKQLAEGYEVADRLPEP